MDEKSKLNRFAPSISLGLVFLLHLSLIRYGMFCDEGDNILGGISIAQGRNLYTDFFSQHTPFAYYVAYAFHRLFGIWNFWEFRVPLAVGTCLGMGLLHMRYQTLLGRFALPLFYFFFCSTIVVHAGHMLLSDLFWGFSIVWLFCECTRAWNTSRLTPASLVIFSLASFVAPMSGFVSIYPVAFVAAWSLIYVARGKWKLQFGPRDLPKLAATAILIAGLAGPYLVALVYFYSIGSLKDFIDQAYFFNRNVYSAYSGGLGSNLVSPILISIKEGVLHFGRAFTLLFQTGYGKLDCTNCSGMILFGWSAYRFFKRDWRYLIFMTGVLVLSNLRGWNSFHAPVSYYLGMLFLATAVTNWIGKGPLSVPTSKTWKVWVGVALVIFLLQAPFNGWKYILTGFPIRENDPKYAMPVEKYKPLLQADDLIWDASAGGCFSYLNTKRIWPGFVYAVVPWVTHVYEDRMLEDLKRLKPKLVLFHPQWGIWGRYFVGEAAPKIFDEIKRNYVPYSESKPDDALWLRR